MLDGEPAHARPALARANDARAEARWTRSGAEQALAALVEARLISLQGREVVVEGPTLPLPPAAQAAVGLLCCRTGP